MLRALSVLGDTLVATASSNPRALPEKDLAARAEPFFTDVEALADPARAAERARELAGPRPCPRHRLARTSSPTSRVPFRRTMSRARERSSVFAFAAFVVVAFAGLAFAAGYLVGRILL